MQQKHPKLQFEQAEVIQLQARFCDGPFSLCFACPLQANQVVPPKRWTSLHMGSWYLYIILCSIWIWSSPTPPVSILIFESLVSLNVSFGKGPYVWFYLEMYLGSTKCLQPLVTSEWSSDKTSHYLPALWYALWHVEGPKIVANLQRTNSHVPKIRIPKPLWWNMQNTKIIHLLVFVVSPQFWAIHLAGLFWGLAVRQLHRTPTPCTGR